MSLITSPTAWIIVPMKGTAMAYVLPSTQKADSVYFRLKEMVVNYRFRPGAQLYSAEMADVLKTSITPVREALTRLAGEGMVDTVTNKGFFARTLSSRDMRERFKLANLILCHAVESADRRLGDPVSAWASLDEPADDQAGDRSFDEPFETAARIESLFVRISALSDNKIMCREIEGFNWQTHYIRMIDLEPLSVRRRVSRDMSRLVASIEKGDVAQAVANLQDQFHATMARMDELVKEGNARALMSSHDR